MGDESLDADQGAAMGDESLDADLEDDAFLAELDRLEQSLCRLWEPQTRESHPMGGDCSQSRWETRRTVAK